MYRCPANHWDQLRVGSYPRNMGQRVAVLVEHNGDVGATYTPSSACVAEIGRWILDRLPVFYV